MTWISGRRSEKSRLSDSPGVSFRWKKYAGQWKDGMQNEIGVDFWQES